MKDLLKGLAEEGDDKERAQTLAELRVSPSAFKVLQEALEARMLFLDERKSICNQTSFGL